MKDGSYNTGYLKLVDQIKTKTTLVSTTGLRNNEGKISMKMEFDPTSTKLVAKETKTNWVVGDTYCGQVTRPHKVDVHYEIPVRLVVATGTIDVKGTDKKYNVPAEHKWFVYLNEPNTITKTSSTAHQFQLTIPDFNWSDIGIQKTQNCGNTLNEFNIGVYGTMFDIINIQ